MNNLLRLIPSSSATSSPGRMCARSWVLVLCVGACLAGPVFADTRVVDVADGDYESLQNALCDAAQGNAYRTVIHLAERGFYAPTRRAGLRPPRWRACQYGGRAGNIPLSPGAGTIFSNVVIRGNNSTLDFEGGTGLSVAETGSLYLEAMELRNTRWALVVNGRAELDRVSIVNSSPEFPHQRAPVHNRGELEMRSTVVAANRLLHVPAELLVATGPLDQCSNTASAGLLNEGSLVANNVTLTGNDWEPVELSAPPSGACVTRDLVNLPGSEARISNSMLTSGLFANCIGTVHSAGYNSVPEGGSCGFVGPGDTVFFRANAFPFVRHDEVRQMDRQLFLPDIERLQSGSPETPGGALPACELLDVRGHVRGLRSGGCYRGALEPGAAPALDSGLDGLWGDPDNDGQYLQISHYGRNRILLIWHSFDSLGGPLWVYASAVFEGGHLIRADAYENTGVRMVDGNLVGELEATPWGELRVESLSCNQLRFKYRALDDGSGDGSNRLLIRLTNNSVADCSD